MDIPVLTTVAPYLLGALVFLLLLRGFFRNGKKPERRRGGGQRGRNHFSRFRSVEKQRSQAVDRTDTVDLGNPNTQIRYVLNADFEKRRIMNKGEYAVYAAARDLLSSISPGHHVFPQVPMGELLASRCDKAFRAINSKRLDLAIVDSSGTPVAAVEYHGNGHFQGTAMQRDRIKKCALERAGIPLIELYTGFERSDFEQRLRSVLGLEAPPTAQ